jgi:hypothetical protein
MQLPSWWRSCPLYLAAIRLRAVVAPVMTTIRRRELERLLVRRSAVMVVLFALFLVRSPTMERLLRPLIAAGAMVLTQFLVLQFH